MEPEDTLQPVSPPTTDTGSIDELISVLIIDDQPSMRSIVRQLLRQQGIEHVSEASTCAEAYEMLHDPEALAPDIIICDLHMDGMDGMEFTHLIRKEEDHTPVLILTGDTTPLLHEVVEQVGANKVLTIPISAPDLAREVHHAVGVF